MIACSICQLERETPLRKDGQPRLPARWLRVQDTIYCPQPSDPHPHSTFRLPRGAPSVPWLLASVRAAP